MELTNGAHQWNSPMELGDEALDLPIDTVSSAPNDVLSPFRFFLNF